MKVEKVGFFSLARWGVGGTFMVVVGSALGIVSLYQWFHFHSSLFLAVAVFLFFSVGAVVFVKAFEEIEPMRYLDEEIVGKVGRVVKEPTPAEAAVVKIGSQLWSAKSDSKISLDDEVLVVRRDGVYVWVKKTESLTQADHSQQT
jgi:membrane protein implicated in regulation of membrane protease activity